MTTASTPALELAALAWQVELGADEAIADAPINRFDQPDAVHRRAVAPSPAAVAAPIPAKPAAAPSGEDAAAAAAACADLPALRAAIAAFEGCALKRGARSLVFADGDPGARVMVVGEAPGREEDMAGLPFVGRSGRLLDAMLAAIGLDRRASDPAASFYVTNVLPWRPPANREPSTDEIAMMRPFLMRHIALKAPAALVLLGASAARSVLQVSTGITRLRGTWTEVAGVPTLPMLHPAALLRDPTLKRTTWADLLTLRARLDADG